MENGFVSPRSEAFPAGLRVLVVDDDPTWLKILEKMLKKCSYEVTKCCLATEALDMLRKRKDGFDIVISDVNMPDMDGFKLLEHVGLEMNLPVIMMSVDGEISRVMKGVLHGACDYLLKPIRMKELQNIWQHVLRKKIHEVKDFEIQEGSESNEKMRYSIDAFDDSHVLTGGDIASARKRKDSETQEFDDQDLSDTSNAKKARVVWSVDLHQKFVNAVNQIGLDKVGPKKILDLMKVPWLSRENVASHLQKYRLYLSRLQKQSQPSFGTLKESDFSSMGSSPCFSLQSSSVMHQSNATSCSFGYSGNKTLVQDVNAEIQEVNSKARLPVLPVIQPKKTLSVDLPYVRKVESGFSMDLANSFGSGRNANYTSFESSSHQTHPWGGDGPLIQFTQLPKEEHRSPQFTAGSKHHNQAALMQPATSVVLGTSFNRTAEVGPSELKPLLTPYRNNSVGVVAPAERKINSASVHPEKGLANTETFKTMSTNIVSPSMKNQSFDHCCTSNLGTQQQNSIIKCAPALASSQGDLHLSSTQTHDYIEDIQLNNLEFLDYLDPELITGLPSQLQLHDGLRFNSDFLFDSMEYPTINEGLFIT